MYTCVYVRICIMCNPEVHVYKTDPMCARIYTPIGVYYTHICSVYIYCSYIQYKPYIRCVYIYAIHTYVVYTYVHYIHTFVCKKHTECL